MLVEAIKEQTVLPKMIMVIPDNNLISCMDFGTKFGISRSIGRVMDWLMTEYDRLIKSAKDCLPIKAKRDNFPQIIWIQAPDHDNFPQMDSFLRAKFNAALSTAAKFHANEHVLELKKVWDSHSLNLYLKEERRFTANGYVDYWMAVDKTVQYVNTILFRKVEKSKEKKSKSINSNIVGHASIKGGKQSPFKMKRDKYHWYRDNNHSANFAHNRSSQRRQFRNDF